MGGLTTNIFASDILLPNIKPLHNWVSPNLPPLIMAFTDFFHFDEEEYRQNKSRPHYPDNELHNNIYRKRREIAASGWSVGVGMVLMHPLGVVVASRTLIVARDKLKLLEMEWARRGYAPLQTHPIRDGAVPCMFAAAVNGLAIGLDLGLGAAGSHVVSHAGHVGAEQLAYGLTQGQGMPSGSEAAFFHGFYNGADQAGAVVQGNGSFGLLPPPMNPAYVVGQAAGVSVAEHAMDYSIQQGANWVQQQAYHDMK